MTPGTGSGPIHAILRPRECYCDLFAGRIPFVAKATKDGGVITEFRLPNYKAKVVRGKGGVWKQEALK